MNCDNRFFEKLDEGNWTRKGREGKGLVGEIVTDNINVTEFLSDTKRNKDIIRAAFFVSIVMHFIQSYQSLIWLMGCDLSAATAAHFTRVNQRRAS